MHPSNLANNAEAFFFNVVGNVDIITIIWPLYDPFDASCSQKLLPCLLEFILVINIEAFVHYVGYLVIFSRIFHFDYKIDNLCTSMKSNSQIVKVKCYCWRYFFVKIKMLLNYYLLSDQFYLQSFEVSN